MNDEAKAQVVKMVPGRCPMCGKPTSLDTRPFCSKRCAELDLGQWLTESYRIPVHDEDGYEDMDPDGEDAR
ncbi:MAG: DNA gyrase inhibitor YacG [Magnetovibrionaceae bacterium]